MSCSCDVALGSSRLNVRAQARLPRRAGRARLPAEALTRSSALIPTWRTPPAEQQFGGGQFTPARSAASCRERLAQLQEPS